MKLEGIWKVSEMTCFGEEGPFWRSAEDCLNDETLDDGLKEPLGWKYLFDADGTFTVLRPLPPGTAPGGDRPGGRRRAGGAV